MTDARTSVRTLVIYVVCIPLALVLGYMLGNPLDVGGVTFIGIVFGVLCVPLLIHYHYPFMFLAWNMGAIVFFLPGRMDLWMVAILLSFAVSFTHRIMDKRVRFLHVPELTRPLVFIVAVVVITAELRGGFGMRSMGGDEVGGRRYVAIFVAIMGYFAMTARQIPRASVHRYIGLFYLTGAVGAVSILYGRIPSALNFIFLFIPPSQASVAEGALVGGGAGMGFFRPFAAAAGLAFAFLLARYGIRQMLSPGRKLLLALFCVVICLQLLSGSRLAFVTIAMTVAFQFWLEGLYRTKLALAGGLLLILAVVVAIPFVTKLPYSIQRTLAVLPIEVDPMVRTDAEGSSEWRREIWRVTIPQIPQYLLLGKGYSISREDLGFMTDAAFKAHTVEERAASIAGDYHNGPLSVIMPLGIWGVIAFVWLLAAGFRVLWRNYKHGHPDLLVINTYLLSSFMVMTISFVFVFGSFYSGLVGYAGLLGFSVALNGGVAKIPVLKSFTPVRLKTVRGPGSSAAEGQLKFNKPT